MSRDSLQEVPKGELDRLYFAPLEEFVKRREALATKLRSDGKSAQAAVVKKLRKPSRAAWVVNQLAGRKREEIADLISAAGDLRSAQEAVLAGEEDGSRLREAAASERRAIERLLGSAEILASEHQVSRHVLDKVAATLESVAGDPETAKLVEQGRLERERSAATVGTAPAGTAPRAKRAKTRRSSEKRRQQLTAAKKGVARIEGRLRRAEAKLNRRRSELDSAKRALEQAEEERSDLERQLEDANSRLRGLEG